MINKSKAAIADGKGNFSILPIAIDDPQGDEVLVQIKAAGICHTDWDSQSWGKQIIMGHEGAGVVTKTGPNVKALKADDSVILNWAVPCYQCFQCQVGNQHLCEVNSAVVAGNGVSGGHARFHSSTLNGIPIERSFSLGTMAEYALVREAACVKVVVDIPFPSAAIISCGVMTGYGSVVNVAKVKAGASVVVLGAGGVGLNVIQGARISGASQIIAIDINNTRLDMAKQYGATDTLLASVYDVGLLEAAKQVKTLTERGADYAFECTAIPALGAAPLAMIRNGGMAVQVSGIEQEINIDMRLFEWDKVYINPLYGKARPQIDFIILQELYASGQLQLDNMVTQTYKLDQLPQAFSDMHKGLNAKGVIIF
jgi:S-(hydroxymethyl)glutathione dehydrogenase/alcohol dehydrogenase